MRWMTMSTTPPKKPETPPMMMPRMNVRKTPTRPMESEMRAPYITRLKRSRLRGSVPKRKISPPSARKRRIVDGMSPQSLYGSPGAKNRMTCLSDRSSTKVMR